MGVARLMKYKIGDKVRIKTWEKGKISHFYSYMEDDIRELNTDRILTIESISKSMFHYIMKEIGWVWKDGMIEEPIYEPIKTRWELLDL